MKKLLITILITVAAVTSAIAVFAADSIVSHSGDEVTAGEGLAFRIDLEQLTEEEFGPYDIAISITPSEPRVWLDVKENVNFSVNRINGTYTIGSAELSALKELNMLLIPDGRLREEVSYDVDVVITGLKDTASEGFTFKALPPENDENNDDGKDDDGKGDKDKKDPGSKDGDKNKDKNKSRDKDKAGKPTEKTGKGGGFSSGGGEAEAPDPKLVYKGSAINYLQSLEIAGFELAEEFNKTRDIYFVDLDSDTTSVDVKAVPCDSSARVDIVGNGNVSEDMSRIIIKVTAQNGDERIYRVYARHGREDNR